MKICTAKTKVLQMNRQFPQSEDDSDEILLEKLEVQLHFIESRFGEVQGCKIRMCHLLINVFVYVVFKKSSGENQDSDQAAVDKRLSQILKDFKAEDFSNCDETGLYYRSLSDYSLSLKNNSNCDEKNKKTITVLLTCNITGTDKNTLVIRKPKNPCCLKGASLPLNYKCTKNRLKDNKIAFGISYSVGFSLSHE